MDYLSNCNDTEYPTDDLSENDYVCSVHMTILRMNFFFSKSLSVVGENILTHPVEAHLKIWGERVLTPNIFTRLITNQNWNFQWVGIIMTKKYRIIISSKSIICLKWEVSFNVGLGEGWVGSFPETYNDPKYLLPSVINSPCRAVINALSSWPLRQSSWSFMPQILLYY